MLQESLLCVGWLLLLPSHYCAIKHQPDGRPWNSKVSGDKANKDGSLRASLRPLSQEISMSSVEIIINRGYPVEMHPVTTEDGYVLMLHRIPYGYQGSSSNSKQGRPVFLQHGFSGSSADWLLVQSSQSLAFRLADLGYDVWLGNARGNPYSRNHVTLDPLHDEDYWEFSFDEMGRYDLPAEFSYVLGTTGYEKLIYIGYSMGTTMFWIAMNYNPGLNSKVELMVALAPVSTLANTKSPFVRYIAPFVTPIQFILKLFQTRVFLSQEAPLVQAQRRYCTKNSQAATFCKNILFSITGADYRNTDLEVLPSINGHMPAGTSVRTAEHFAQNYNGGEKFLKYDFGFFRNWVTYGRFRPPSYDLSRVTTPVHIFHGQKDYFATPADVDWLASRLPNLQSYILIEDPEFNHESFLSGKDTNRLLYDKVIALLPSP